MRPMNSLFQNMRLPIWVVGLCLLVSFVGIADRDLWTPDEPRDAAISLEMAATGEMVVPHLAGEPFVEKPPLYFAVAARFVKAVGLHLGSVGAIRLSSAVWGVCTLIVTFLLVKRLVGPEIALITVLILATMEGFVENMHWIRVDAALIFFVVAAMWAFSEVYLGKRKWFCALGGLFTAGAFLTKGAVGPVLIAIGWLGLVVPWLIGQRGKEKSDFFVKPHIVALLVFLLPALSWMFLLRKTGGPEVWHEWFWENHFGRLSGAAIKLGHIRKDESLYYLRTITMYCLPWSPLILVWLWQTAKHFAGPKIFPPVVDPDHPWQTVVPDDDAASPGRHRRISAHIFLLVWAVGSVIVLTLSATKRDIYLLPVLPAFAIMCAETARDRMPRWCEFFLDVWVSIVVVALALLAATSFLLPILKFMLPVVARFVPSIPPTLDFGKMQPLLAGFTHRHLVAAVCFLVCGLLADRTQAGVSFFGRVVVATALFWIGGIAVAGKAVDMEKSMREDYMTFFSRIPKSEQAHVAGWNLDETTLACFYCYAGWKVPIITDKKRLSRIVAGQDREFGKVIVAREPSLKKLFDVPYRIVLEASPGDKFHEREIDLVTHP